MYEQIAANKRRTALLIAAFVVLLVAVGVAVNALVFQGGAIGVVLAVVICRRPARSSSYWKSDSVALAVSRAHPADPTEYKRLYNLVEGLTIASGLPMPRVYIIDDPAPNAFATGRNPRHAAVAVTTGLLEKMNRVELEGVLAHELQPREELRHPRLDAGGHHGGRHRPRVRRGHPRPVVGRRAAQQQRPRQQPGGRDPRHRRASPC